MAAASEGSQQVPHGAAAPLAATGAGRASQPAAAGAAAGSAADAAGAGVAAPGRPPQQFARSQPEATAHAPDGSCWPQAEFGGSATGAKGRQGDAGADGSLLDAASSHLALTRDLAVQLQQLQAQLGALEGQHGLLGRGGGGDGAELAAQLAVLQEVIQGKVGLADAMSGNAASLGWRLSLRSTPLRAVTSSQQAEQPWW
jgi:hypothetical protein